jgi:hypothetical protein
MRTDGQQGPEIWIRGPVTVPEPGPREPAHAAATARRYSWVGTHGGAGVSTLAAVYGGHDCAGNWPGPDDPRSVLLVARTHACGLAAALRRLGALPARGGAGRARPRRRRTGRGRAGAAAASAREAGPADRVAHRRVPRAVGARLAPRRPERNTAAGDGGPGPPHGGIRAPQVRTVMRRPSSRRSYAVTSFVVNRAQAAEPNTAAYRAWSSRFFTRPSQ